MKWVLGGVVAVSAVATVVNTACSYGCRPTAGITPYPGQSDVPVDVVIAIRRGESLPRDLPSLDGEAVGLMRGDGELVDVDIEIDFEEGIVRLVPTQALEPDADYFAWGLDEAVLENRDYVVAQGLGVENAETWFHTGPRLAALEVLDGIVVFSEPIDPRELDGAVHAFTVDGKDLGEVPVSNGERSFEVRLSFPEGPASYIVVSAGITAESGARLEKDTQLVLREDEPVVDWYSGEPVCESPR